VQKKQPNYKVTFVAFLNTLFNKLDFSHFLIWF